ncbi:MAG: MCE family protein [Pseudolabrys sp.]|nr:MCE family protein [Pseudolabrys sp.]MBV9954181.1 MCE family protein [Pseudolabrys sp.]
METRANYALIGLFTIAVVAAVFGFVYWFQSVGGTGERAQYRIVFEEPVSGLRTGAAVLFNGIRVGEVGDLRLNAEKPQQVITQISIDKSVQIRPDTRVSIEFQGLTGIASIALAGGSSDKPPLPNDKNNPATLVASRGQAQDVTQGAREVLRRLDDFIADNESTFKNALKNIETFSASLARNSERVDRIIAGLENLLGGADGKSGEVAETAKALRTLAANLDKRTDEITDGINKFTAAGTREFGSVGRTAREALSSIDRAAKQIGNNPSSLLFGGGSRGQSGQPQTGRQQ